MRIGFRTYVSLIISARLQAVALIRLAAVLHRYSPALATAVKYVNQVVTGCDVAAGARIGSGLTLFHPNGLVIGPRVIVGNRCVLMQHVTLGHGRGGSPRLGDGVFIGPGAVVVGAITVGDGAYIAANSVVTRHVPPGQLWRGNPAEYLRDM